MDDTNAIIHRIQNGEDELRESFLESNREFIRRCASSICKRPLDWNNDDELSISLIAFNKAIDSFDITSSKSFAAFAKMLIKNSLVDHFRTTSKNGLLFSYSFEEQEPAAAQSATYSVHTAENGELGYEIEFFKDILEDFGLTLKDLTRNSPNHRKTRENLKDIAKQAGNQKQLVRSIYSSKKLPLQQIHELTGARRKTLEKWRRYLLSLIIIYTSEDLKGVAEYIWGKEAQRSEE